MGWILTAVLTALAAPAGSAGSLNGQAWERPLAPDHWSYPLMRQLDLASAPGAWVVRSRPLRAGSMLEGLEGGAQDTDGSSLGRFTTAWAERLRQEVGADARGVQAGFGLGAVRSDAEVVQARGGFARGIVDASFGEAVGAWF
ncbi:MAG: hypothetical protein OEO23_14885, partial [Gemmatimonadota bacterium]|nr:hypothetical protein [Gemmatimonadota bacterium]